MCLIYPIESALVFTLIHPLRLVVEEYKKTISDVAAERERERVVNEIEKEKISAERSQVIDDLKSAERAFNDVHRY